MDGTLVDSEKIWDISLAALYDKLGGELTPAVRASMVGSVAETTMRIVYTDLGLDLDPAAMERSSRWLNDYTAELFENGLPWCGGAKELLDDLAAEGTPMALVTNTQRALDRARFEEHWPALFLGDGVRGRGGERQAGPRPLSARRRPAGRAAGKLPGRRRFRGRKRGRRARRMPGVGGAQRRRGARRQSATACFFAGRTGCR